MPFDLRTNNRQCQHSRRRKLSTNSESTIQSEDQNVCENFNLNKNLRQPFEPKYKTELCKNFSETGFCPYRKKCKFAHGSNELNNNRKEQGRFYRTKKCTTFWNEGRCPYGQRCQFMHVKLEESTKRYLDSWRFVIEMQTNQSGFQGSKLLRLLQLDQTNQINYFL